MYYQLEGNRIRTLPSYSEATGHALLWLFKLSTGTVNAIRN
jgi:hypothetical protein